jgi:hypothetical protein
VVHESRNVPAADGHTYSQNRWKDSRWARLNQVIRQAYVGVADGESG